MAGCKIGPVRRRPEGSVGFGKTAAKKQCAWAVADANAYHRVRGELGWGTRTSITSVPTMWVRSSGCSMMDMKDSPRFVETNMWAMANRRSGRKA